LDHGRFLVVSDLHLSDFEEHADGWKSHKRAEHSIDEDFSELLRSFEGDGADGVARVLVLNGDIFDFDLVTRVPEDPSFPVSVSERSRGLLPTAEKSAWKLQRMMRDHRSFMLALARFLSRGHQVVYVMGNHDRELHFPEVQRAFLSELRTCAASLGATFGDHSIRFEPWFYYVPGVLYAEHGQQYDSYSSFPFLLSPVVETREGREIALTMGNLSNRYLVNRMGFFNPHASDYILSVFHYVMHWLRFYAFTRRSIVFNWFFGSLQVMARLLTLREAVHTPPANHDDMIGQAARRAGLPHSTLRALSALHRAPITTRFYRILREFWIDRLLLSVLMVLGTAALAVAPVPTWVKFMVPLSAFPLLYFVYESLARGETIFSAEQEIPRYAMKISGLIDASVVTFGHTHRPRVVPLGLDRVFVDTGTWAPMTPGGRTSEEAPGFRNYLMVTSEGSRVTHALGSRLPVPQFRSALAPEHASAPMLQAHRSPVRVSPSRA